MAVLPNSREEMIAWFGERIAAWSTNAALLGLDMTQVTDIATLISDAQTDLDAAIASRTASRDATVAYHNGADALRAYGADLIKVIKATAESTDNPDIYAVASIPPPAPPTPAGAPEQPTNITVALIPTGGLHVSWKGTVSLGAYFAVYRRAEGETAFTLLDAPKVKSFDDTAVPAGANTVSYYIQARRDEFRVNSAVVQVSFGAGGAATLALAA